MMSSQLDLAGDTTLARTPNAWRGVGSASAVIAWGGNQFTPLLVMYRHDRGLSLVTVDLMLAAYVVGIVPALLIGGPLSDRYGRRRLFLPAPFIAMAASALLAVGASVPAMLFAGRIVSGVAIGLAMAVGTSWIKELSCPPLDPQADDGVGARRASLSLTAGFLLGAGVAGALAQWAPWPEVLPYLAHIAISIPLALAVLATPETRSRTNRPTSLRDDLRVPSISHVRFVRTIVPSAPWVFGCAGVAYAVLPGLVASQVGGLRVAFSATATVVALGCGVLIQPFARRLDRPASPRGSSLALTIALMMTAVGMALAALAADRLSVPFVLIAAALLGCAYGTNLVSGLLLVQRIAEPHDLAGLTAAYYALSYVGFGAPATMSLLAPHITYVAMLSFGAIVAAATCCLVATQQ